MKKKILFVVNNLSGTVSSYNIPKCVDIFLDKELYEPSIFFIDNNIDETIYSQKINEDWDTIVSVGGDGTLLELGQRVIDRNIILGIIPIGSGNGLATHLGYKPRKIEAAFEALNNAIIQPIDVAKIDDKYFFSNFGVGIDAVVAKDFKIKKKRSFLVYIYLTLKRVFKIKSTKVKFYSNGKEYEEETYLFNVFNSNLYGYNVGLIPWANAFDGLLDVAYLRKIPIWRMVWAAICILIKKPKLSKDIVFFQTEDITIFNDSILKYQIDGDPKVSNEHDIQIKVLSKKLKMIVPQKIR